jgi:feruloyl esterase
MLIVAMLAGSTGPMLAAAADCAELQGREFAGARAVAASRVGGTFTSPSGDSFDVPPACRVQLEATPTPGSSIRAEVWLPERRWNGRFYQVGNGGLAGAIEFRALAWQAGQGNAVASTDTGHSSPSILSGAWALGAPERVKDYGYRSLKITRDAALAVIAAHYGTAARYRYFTGCSAGARQGLMLAQRFPEDWDGILAGSGPHDLIRFFLNAAAIGRQWQRHPDGRVPEALLPVVQRESRRSCSLLPSGIPANPFECRPATAALRCGASSRNPCLTPAQSTTLERLYEGTADYPGFPAGNEAEIGGGGSSWALWLTGRNPGAAPLNGYDRPEPMAGYFAREFFANVVFGRSSWSLDELDIERDLRLAEDTDVAGESLRSVLGGRDGDLSGLRDRGGKLLVYFGGTDEVVSPRDAVAFHAKVVRDTPGGGAVDDYYRLFIAPGMGHCIATGPGANSFGQFADGSKSPPLRNDARHSVERALEAWVERGIAPDRITATRWAGNDPASGRREATYPLCVYPRVARFRGRGDPRDAAGYVCEMPAPTSTEHTAGRAT